MKPYVITTMFAFVSTDKNDNGDEGIVAFLGPDGHWMPAVGSDPVHIKILKTLCDSQGIRYTIKHFELTKEEENESLPH